ncbi:shikimate kinase [Gammaproteobacteria bacterium]|nr:shikimate kinase [Gammaproteobacteria bacterium]
MTAQPYQRIYLVGLMGSGKTALGRRLAERLGWQFIDCDHRIEERCGVSIRRIFEIEGESGFREREVRMMQELSYESMAVIATGGGAVMREENRAVLKDTGFVVYLDASVRTLLRRTANSKSRPLLNEVEDREQLLTDLLTLREPLYREVADLEFRSTHNTLSRVSERLHHQIQEQWQH